MGRVTLCSLMRNSMGYIDRYYKQVSELRDFVPGLQVIVGEGDSRDQTATLARLTKPSFVDVVDVTHGGEAYGSIDHPQRWKDLAGCVKKVIARAGDLGDAFIWVESDLIWMPNDMLRLLSHLDKVSAVAPKVMAGGERRFYDYWGFRINGQLFTAGPPYFPDAELIEVDGLTKIDSCGNCFVLAPAAFDTLTEWDGIWPFPGGGALWIDPTVEVHHP